ncbi:MAG: MTAP family purine nucleoside phosphorylase [Nitrospinae bacterium]|nr:MTAP family purine nucleoside phosphorylase [Nitrospinota bacterium]
MAKPPPFSIPFAVIGGSGAYSLLSENSLGQELACDALDTPFGKSAPIHRFRAGETEFLFLSRHGEKDYSLTAPFVNYRANLYALKDCGAEQIVSWSGPGIINKAYRPGEFVIPHDVIDETRNRPTTFFEGRGVGFIRQSEPFCPRMRLALHDVIHDAALPHHEQAVYACTEGPRLESPAEIRKLRIIGADLVGMTLIPEAFLARELEMCYASVCYLTNYAEGVVEREFKEGELFEGMQNADERSSVENSINNFPAIIKGCFERMKGQGRNCNCKEALRRYKNKGMISEDWRAWFSC